MNAIFKLTLKSQIFIIKEHLEFALFGLIGYLIFVYFEKPFDIFGIALFFTAWYTIINLIPSLFLHYQYNKYNKGVKVVVDPISRTMTIDSDGSTQTFNFNQIKSIRLSLTSALYRGDKRGLCAWDLYHYAVVEIEAEKQFVITCLLINDLRTYIKELGLKAIKERVFFPLIYTGEDRIYMQRGELQNI
jgi:hypothetical protein